VGLTVGAILNHCSPTFYVQLGALTSLPDIQHRPRSVGQIMFKGPGADEEVDDGQLLPPQHVAEPPVRLPLISRAPRGNDLPGLTEDAAEEEERWKVAER
jgi:hypothetical protein